MDWHKKNLACSGNMLVNTSCVCYMDYMLIFKTSFQNADDILNTKNYLAFRALSTMNKNQMSLKQAQKLFGLWDDAYHANGLKNLDPARRWDPAKMVNLRRKKVEKAEDAESSSEEESEGKFWLWPSQRSQNLAGF